MDTNQTRLSFREKPITLWIVGIIMLCLGVFFYFQHPTQLILPAIVAGIGLLILITASIVDVMADKVARTLTISRRSPLRKFSKTIPFDDIQGIQMGTSVDDEDGTSTYRVEIALKDGSIVPLRSVYSSGRSAKVKRIQQLSEFIGVSGENDLLSNAFRAAAKQAQPQFKAEQESITGDQDIIHETDGVHWQLETLAHGGSPLTRWHSNDFRLPNSFLYLVQKTEGQKDLPDIKLLNNMVDMLFQRSIQIFSFDDDAPDAQNADLIPLDERLAPFFFAYTNDSYRAKQILTPWASSALANWVARHPFKEGSNEQLGVLFGPNGLYLGVMGYVNQEYLDELTNLGVELIHNQGSMG